MVKATLPLSMIDVLTKKANEAGYGGPSPYAVQLCINAMMHERTIRAFTPYFRRGYVPRWDKSRVMLGHVIAPKMDALLPDGGEPTKRFPLKFLPDDYLALGELAYAFNCSIAQAATILVTEALIQEEHGLTVEPLEVAVSG